MNDNDSFDDVDGILDDILSSGSSENHSQKCKMPKSPVSTRRTKKETSAPPTVGKDKKTQSKISSFFQADEPKDFMYTLDKLLEEKEQEELSQKSARPTKPSRSLSDPWKTPTPKRKSKEADSSLLKDDEENDNEDDILSFEPAKKKTKKGQGKEGKKKSPKDVEIIRENEEEEEDDIFAPINHFTELLKSQRVQEETKIIRENFFRYRISLPDIMGTSPEGKTLNEWEAIITSGFLGHVITSLPTDTQRESVLEWLFKVAGSHTNKRLVYVLTEQLQGMWIPNTGRLVLEMLSAHGGDVPGFQSALYSDEPTLDESQKARESLPERDHNLAAILQLACSETTFPTDDIQEEDIVPLFQCLVSISVDSYFKSQNNESKSLDASRIMSCTRTLLNKIIVRANAREISLVDPLLDERKSKSKSYKRMLKRIEAIPMLSTKSRLLRLNASWTALSSLVGMSSVDADSYSIEALTDVVIPAVKSALDKSSADAIAGIAVPSILNDLCLGDNIVIDKDVGPVENFIEVIERSMKGSLVSQSLTEDILSFTDFLKKLIKEYN